MKLILDDSELEEITIDSVINSKDRAIVKLPPKKEGREQKQHDEVSKELAALDSMEHPVRKLEEIHNIPKTNINDYSNGKDVSEDTRTNILTRKFDIADKATTKLMESLDLFQPDKIEKQEEIIKAASHLSTIVERMSGKDGREGNKVELHLHAPIQRKEKDYEVIDV